TSGAALRAAVPAGPDLIKPNREELAEAVGGPVDTIADVVEAAGELRDRGARAVLVSLGAEGAVLVDDDGVLTGEAPVARPNSTVGAGDALLAGFLAGGARGPAALAEALAWGAAAVRLPASRMPGEADIRRDNVRIRPRPVLTRPRVTYPARPVGRSVRKSRSAEPSAKAQVTENVRTHPRSTGGRDGHRLHPRAHGNRAPSTGPAVRRQAGRDGHAEHRRVHRLGSDHRVVHRDRLAPQRGPGPDGRPDDQVPAAAA